MVGEYINWQHIKSLSSVPKCASSNVTERFTLLAKYPRLWKEGLEVAVGIKGTLTLKESAIPVFCKARSIPYGMRKLVEAELEKLQKDGVISPVTLSEWATPLVVVPKGDGRVRLCGDFKVSVNPALKIDQYPLPKVEDMFATLGKSTVFSKVVLKLSIFTAGIGGGSKKAGSHEHTQRSIPVQPLTLWNTVCPSYLAENHGPHLARNTQGA